MLIGFIPHFCNVSFCVCVLSILLSLPLQPCLTSFFFDILHVHWVQYIFILYQFFYSLFSPQSIYCLVSWYLVIFLWLFLYLLRVWINYSQNITMSSDLFNLGGFPFFLFLSFFFRSDLVCPDKLSMGTWKCEEKGGNYIYVVISLLFLSCVGLGRFSSVSWRGFRHCVFQEQSKPFIGLFCALSKECFI